MKKTSSSLASTYIIRWWFPLISVVVVVLGTLLVLIPQLKQIMELSKTIGVAKTELIQAQSKINQIAQLDLSEVDRLLLLADSALPTHKPFFEVLSLMQRLSVETGAALGQFEFSPGSLASSAASKADTSSGYTTLTTDVSIMGTSEQVSQFIEKIQQATPIVSVESIEISGKTVDGVDQRKANLVLAMYHTNSVSMKQQAMPYEPLPTLDDEKKAVYTTLSQYVLPVTTTTENDSVVDLKRTNLFSY